MKNINILICSFLLAFGLQNVNAQCSDLCTIGLGNDNAGNDIYFPSTTFTDQATNTSTATDIIAGGASVSILNDQAFDILGASGCAPGTDGTNDVTFSFVLEDYFDVYGGTMPAALVPTGDNGGSDRWIRHTSSGFQGQNATRAGNNDVATSTGDVSCYNITVEFATPQEAQDVTVNTTSINTGGETYESGSIIFLDGSYNPYGTATYNGFYVDADGAGGNHPGVLAAGECAVTQNPNNTGAANYAFPTVNAPTDIYTTTGVGVYVSSDTDTVQPDLNADTVDDFGTCTPISWNNGDDNPNVNANLDTGLGATDLVGGFVFRVCLEDIATAEQDGVETTSNTNFTSTLNSFTMCNKGVCQYTADVAFTEVCGQFTIDVTNIIASGTTDDTIDGNVEYSIDGGTNWVAYTAGTQLPADGSALLVQLVDPSDVSCTSEVFNGNAPLGSTPNVPAFVPNNPTITTP